jgi:hypothetical protein
MATTADTEPKRNKKTKSVDSLYKPRPVTCSMIRSEGTLQKKNVLTF